MKATAITIGIICWLLAFLWAGWEAARNASLSAEADDHAACTAYLTGKKAVGSEHCDPALVDLVSTARASLRCDQALLLDGVSLDCSYAVQGLYAQKADLQSQLETTVADQAAAIARAEKRATATAQRKIKDAAALQLAPRQPDGLIVCDTDCLRQRFEP